jgi:hypothetical protein
MWHTWDRTAHKVLVEKPAGNKPFGISKIRRKDNIKSDLK